MDKPLQGMVQDLLKDYHENNKSFDNIAESAECEEDCDDLNSDMAGSDFERHEYEEAMDFLKRPFQSDQTVTGKDGTQLTPLPMEYTEYNGQSIVSSTQGEPNFAQTIMGTRPRRGRKERSSKGKKGSTITTSSSGINATSSNAGYTAGLYEYNTNQLAAQYGNTTSPNDETSSVTGIISRHYAEDLELGMGSGAATASYSINNYQMSDEERGGADEDSFDPEALTPMTHFSNNRDGLDSKGSKEEKIKATKSNKAKK